MEAFKDVNIDWEGDIDDNKLVVSDFPMPDGSKHYLEMSMLHWYWAHFIRDKTDAKLEQISQDALDVMSENTSGEEGMSFDELIQYGLMVFGKRWVKNTTGRG